VEIIQGKKTRALDGSDLACLVVGYPDILVDLGTGDGRFILHATREESSVFGIGIDACRENLVEASRRAPANALFGIANLVRAENALSYELTGLAARVTINFPWGSLRDALLTGEASLLQAVWAVMRPGAQLDIRLNASALAEAGIDLLAGCEKVAQSLAGCGFKVQTPRSLAIPDLRGLPSTWAKRLACGRYPAASYINACRPS
jgi:hypothetical protein